MRKIKASIIFLILFSGCNIDPEKPPTNTLHVYNHSSKSIVVAHSYNYPDLKLPTWGQSQYYIKTIAPCPDCDPRYLFLPNWKTKIAKNPKDTLVLFIMDPDTLKKYSLTKKYSWGDSVGYNKVRASNNFLTLKKISSGDVKSGNNIFINYP